jgi:hypothetical protein
MAPEQARPDRYVLQAVRPSIRRKEQNLSEVRSENLYRCCLRPLRTAQDPLAYPCRDSRCKPDRDGNRSACLSSIRTGKDWPYRKASILASNGAVRISQRRPALNTNRRPDANRDLGPPMECLSAEQTEGDRANHWAGLDDRWRTRYLDRNRRRGPGRCLLSGWDSESRIKGLSRASGGFHKFPSSSLTGVDHLHGVNLGPYAGLLRARRIA